MRSNRGKQIYENETERVTSTRRPMVVGNGMVLLMWDVPASVVQLLYYYCTFSYIYRPLLNVNVKWTSRVHLLYRSRTLERVINTVELTKQTTKGEFDFSTRPTKVESRNEKFCRERLSESFEIGTRRNNILTCVQL